MRLSGRALRLTVLVGEDDVHLHGPLCHEIAARTHRAGPAGASVFHGVEGFGASSAVHTARLLSLGGDLPVAIVIVDEGQRIRDFLPQLDEPVTEDVVLLDEREVIRYAGRAPGSGRRR